MTESSKCVIILANKVSKDPILEDYRNILHTFSVKQYVYMMTGKEIRVCLQLLKPENKDLYFSSLGGSEKDQVLNFFYSKHFLNFEIFLL